MTTSTSPNRLTRRLHLSDAVVIGLGAMIGAGVFAAFAPAARAAGEWLVLGLAIAAFVAWCNAVSSAQLAARHPESGGAYAYGRRRLNAFWGFLAGWSFVVGKLASATAMALTFASHAAPGYERPVAASAVLVLTALDYRGVQKTVTATRVLLVLVLVALAVSVVGALGGGQAELARLVPDGPPDVYGVLQAAGLLFFAFAGYARLATLGEEVIDPTRTIPRAIPIALWITLGVYVVVGASALAALGPQALAQAHAPLAEAVEVGRLSWLSPVVRAGGVVASLGVLLSLLVGIGRTTFAMAAAGDLPHALSAVHPRFGVPHRAQVAVGLVVSVAVLVTDLRGAIGFSSFAVLTYYAVANAAALRLGPDERLWPRWVSWAGLVGCVVVASSLPVSSVTGGLILLVTGAVVWALRRR